MQSQTNEKVREIIAEALYLEKAEVTSDASLVKDLGAESIDFLDIVFRLEKAFNVKIPKGDVEKRARGGLSEEEFQVGGIIQPKGLEALKVAMPEVDPAEFRQGLNVREIGALFTVATFSRMVDEQQGGAAPKIAAAPVADAVPPPRITQPVARL